MQIEKKCDKRYYIKLIVVLLNFAPNVECFNERMQKMQNVAYTRISTVTLVQQNSEEKNSALSRQRKIKRIKL